MLNIISLGAGVQSSTMALMAARGLITPMPDAAIFADTGWEPIAVYNWLYQLEEKLPFPVYRVSEGNLREDLLNSTRPGGTERRYASVPFFTGNGGMGMRQCTKDYKLVPLWRKTRELLGQGRPKPGAVSMWIGISTDEAQRMKPAAQQYISNRWPLIEMGISRLHCLEWMRESGYPKPPKSSCLGCPYHDNKQWLDIKKNSPSEWAETVAMDAAIRVKGGKGSAAFTERQFMHRSMVPLDQVDFRQIENQADLFGDECEGVCGV